MPAPTVVSSTLDDTGGILRYLLLMSDGSTVAIPYEQIASTALPTNAAQETGGNLATLAARVPAVGADASTTINLGGTAQNLFSGAIPANGFEVVNPDATEDLWISDATTAVANGTGCIRVAANGGWYCTPPGMRPFHAVSIVGATTGHKFTARAW